MFNNKEEHFHQEDPQYKGGLINIYWSSAVTVIVEMGGRSNSSNRDIMRNLEAQEAFPPGEYPSLNQIGKKMYLPKQNGKGDHL